MSLHDEIRSAQIRAGEDAVIRNLERLGLATESPQTCDGCTTPGTCKTHGCAVPTEAQKLERAKTAAYSALNAAEKAWHDYAALCDVGDERTMAFQVFENIRTAVFVRG